MDFIEYIEIKYNYIKALYFIDEYTTMHRESDLMLEEILNYLKFDETLKGFYLQTILWKAKAYQNNNERKKAILAYKELSKLAPETKTYRRTLFSLLYQENYIRERKILAWVVLFLLVSLIINALLIFFINPFYQDFREPLEMCRNGLFAIGFLLFLTLQVRHVWTAFKELEHTQ